MQLWIDWPSVETSAHRSLQPSGHPRQHRPQPSARARRRRAAHAPALKALVLKAPVLKAPALTALFLRALALTARTLWGLAKRGMALKMPGLGVQALGAMMWTLLVLGGSLAWGTGAVHGMAPFPPADVLLISNSPETVREPGILFQRTLEPHTRYRLFLHHLNQTDADRLSLRVHAVAPKGPASGGEGAAVGPHGPVTLLEHRVHQGERNLHAAEERLPGGNSEGGQLRLTVAGLGMSPYPFTSGWQALERYSAAEAPTQTLPLQPWPGQEVWGLRLAPGQVATGYLLLEVDQPAHLVLQLGDDDTPLAPDGLHPRAVIAAPEAREQVYFDLKDKLLELRFGSSGTFRDLDTDAPLRGEYGIDYRWDLTVHNPHEVPMPLHLLFIPRGSDGRLLIHVDGKAYQTGRTFSGHYSLVNRWVIYPGQTRTFSLWTTPVPAMGYPAVLRFSTYLDPGWPRHPTP